MVARCVRCVYAPTASPTSSSPASTIRRPSPCASPTRTSPSPPRSGRELGVPMRVANLALEELTEALGRGWAERDSRVAMLL